MLNSIPTKKDLIQRKQSIMFYIFEPKYTKRTCSVIIYAINILVRVLRELVINLDFLKNFVGWKETKISIKLIHCEMRTKFEIQERKNIRSATNRIE